MATQGSRFELCSMSLVSTRSPASSPSPWATMPTASVALRVNTSCWGEDAPMKVAMEARAAS